MIGYVTTLEFEAYALARGIVLANDPSAMLTRAFDWLELQRFSGRKTDPAQALEWPRNGDSSVPSKIKQAQMVCALVYDQGGDPLGAIGQRVTQETVVGAVSVSYSDNGPLTTLYPMLTALLRDYLAVGSGGGGFTVTRA